MINDRSKKERPTAMDIPKGRPDYLWMVSTVLISTIQHRRLANAELDIEQ
jgi:hypothetical protein